MVLNPDPETRVADSGAGSSGQETDYFGSLTDNAIRRFEKKYGFTEDGIVDAGVRAKLNQLLLQNFFAHADYNMRTKFGVGPTFSAVPSSYGTNALGFGDSNRVIYSSYYGVFEVRGAIKAVYQNEGSQLGFPMSDEYPDATTGRQRSNFEGGYIAYDVSMGGYRPYVKNDVQTLEPTPQVLQSMRTFEYFCGNLYNDGSSTLCGTESIGNCTIGYGHKVHDGPCDGKAEEGEFKSGVTRQRGEELFRDDVRDKAVNPIRAKVTVPLNQHQFDALVHYTYNAGEGSGIDDLLERSQLNASEHNNVPGTLIRTRPTWNQGEYAPGLGNRREREAFIFAEGKY